MDKIIELNKSRRTLYETDGPYETGHLQVSDLHSVYYEVSGNMEGLPAVVLHGGPGGGLQPFYRAYFDPTVYKVVLFDQRGAGKSTPEFCLENNTTWDLVSDIEKLREHLKVEKWHTVFGGSWGSTLSLAYSEAYPTKVGHLVLRGIFLTRTSEIQFFYQEGTSWIFPDYHQELVNLLPENERQDIVGNYYKHLIGNDEEFKLKCAKAWTKYEMATSKLFVNEALLAKGEQDRFALAFARIETHYFVNNCFFKQNQLIDDSHKIKHIPTIIVQGRYDVICPVKSAYDLKQKLPEAELYIIPDAGHSCTEPGIVDALVKATDKFKTDK